jgi:hypothetical protein
MLKIKIWMRGTFEYSQDTIPGPTEDQTQDQFEESFIESDECYWGGEVYETCPYFDEHGYDSIDVYLGGDNHIANQEEPIFTTSDWSQFKFEEGGGCNYISQVPDKVGEVNIWWSHDMKFNHIYYWENVTEFDPKKITIQYGTNQKDQRYLEEIYYDGEPPDDCHDHGDTGYGYNGPEFIYHPDQKFAENNEE